MIEISLPPGAVVQSDLGQIEVVKVQESGGDQTIEIDELSKNGTLSYKIPIKELTEEVTFRSYLF